MWLGNHARAYPFRDGFDTAPGDTRHGNKARWMRNNRRLWRRGYWQQQEQPGPESVLQFKLFPRLGDVAHHQRRLRHAADAADFDADV